MQVFCHPFIHQRNQGKLPADGRNFSGQVYIHGLGRKQVFINISDGTDIRQQQGRFPAVSKKSHLQFAGSAPGWHKHRPIRQIEDGCAVMQRIGKSGQQGL